MTAAILAALALFGTQQAAPAPPCAGPEYRQMDFWVGDWDLSFTLANGGTARAANRITRDEYGDCVIVEHFSQPGGGANGDFIGTSVSTYDTAARLWRQTWVDNAGGLYFLEGGPVEGQPHFFEMKTATPIGQNPAYMRMIWQEATADSLVWRWQRQTADGGWSDQWVLNYRRRPTD